MSKYLWIGLGMLGVEFIIPALYLLGQLDIDWAKAFLVLGFVMFNIVALVLIIAGATKETNKKEN